MTSLSKIFQANFRNHRKLVVVDGNLAFTGGLNVGEEYAARRSKSKRRIYWRDTHLEIHGSPVDTLEQVFFEDWIFATGDTTVKRPKQLIQSVVRTAPGHVTVQVVPTGPTDDAFTGVLLMLNLINSATSRLWISSPYFVPDSAILRALELAAMRGVDVRLILPEKSDSKFVHWVSLTYAEDLQLMGVQTFLYHAGFVHQKVILVDDDCAAIGTMNFDNRAMYFNFETTVVILDNKFVSEVARMLEKDLTHCKTHLPPPSSIPNTIRRFRDQTIRLLSPLL
jgi:cardiolipin synthase